MRPRSIIQFAWIYLASTLVSFIMAFYALDMVQTMAQEAGGPELEGTASTVLVILIFVFGLLVPIILWACVVFLASRVAKWILVVFSLLSILNSVASMPNPLTILGAMALMTTVLTILAVVLLFMPDADEWFRQRRGW